MRPSIVSFQMTTDCTGPDDAGETDGKRLPGGHTNRKRNGLVVVVVVEIHREEKSIVGTSGDRHGKDN